MLNVYKFGSNRTLAVGNEPNAKLFSACASYPSFAEKQVWRFVHVTPNLDRIEEGAKIYPSTGCLVGAVYVVPVVDGEPADTLRVHNLGGYYLDDELPRILASRGMGQSEAPAQPTEALLLELHFKERFSSRRLLEIDYLCLGDLHLSVYKDFEFLLSSLQRKELVTVADDCLPRAIPLIQRAIEITFGANGEEFYSECVACARSNPWLGYVLFESVCRLFFMFSRDPLTLSHARLGEISSRGYKSFLFRMLPSLGKSFNLSNFRPGSGEVVRAVASLANHEVDERECKRHLDWYAATFITHALGDFEVGSLLRSCPTSRAILAGDCEPWHKSLLGHFLHRRIKLLERYEAIAAHFDQARAYRLWSYARKNNISMVVNGLAAKGEFGLIPLIPEDVELRAFRATVGGTQIQDVVTVHKNKEVRVELSTSLTPPPMRLMGGTDSSIDRDLSGFSVTSTEMGV